MTGQELCNLWNTDDFVELRQYIKQQAIRHAKRDRERQKDLIQEAWIAVSVARADSSLELLQRLALAEINRRYKLRRAERSGIRLDDLERMSGIMYAGWCRGLL